MWEISVGSQAATVALSLALGAALCFVYDIIRAIRKAGADSDIAVFAGDMIFWLISAFSVFIFLICTTNGEIRAYVIFSAAAGFIIYRFTVGRLVYPVFRLLFCFAAQILAKTVYFSAKLCLFAERRICFLSAALKRSIAFVFSYVKKVLKCIYNMVYTKKDKKEAGDDLRGQGR